MLAVAVIAAVWWRRASGLTLRWLWIGAGLWAAAVALKFASAFMLNKPVIGFLQAQHSPPLFLAGGGLFLGLHSALWEIGLTFLAARIWPQLGRDAPRAAGVGVGAGAFEALLLGMAAIGAAVVALSGTAAGGQIASAIHETAAASPLFWLAAPLERALALLNHVATRALALLGAAHRRPWMILGGFLLFSLTDGIAGAFHLTGKVRSMPVWWIELAILPSSLACIPILRWCWRRWAPHGDGAREAVE